MARLMEKYRKEIVPQLREEFKRTNPMSLPRLSKIVLSAGLGKAVAEGSSKAGETKRFGEAEQCMTTIAGQKPVRTRARAAISNFKLREGFEIGLKVTLRGQRMYEFLDRLVSLAIPRVRDFRGLNPNSFDGRGNFSTGFTEFGVFPEVPADQINYQQGMNVCICTTAPNDAEARRLLTLLGVPFRS